MSEARLGWKQAAAVIAVLSVLAWVVLVLIVVAVRRAL